MTCALLLTSAADPQAQLRKAWVATLKAHAAADRKGLDDWLRLDLRPFAGLRCGARTRAGAPCKMLASYACGRCRLHGGLSTGPRTPAGKATSALNGRAAKRANPMAGVSFG